ncbi:SseB family protein [Glycomyces harbinensis]|uniref:SseB protein N-terminal domain-containing protein n=1 Tax=Glycomyces harbinensis TaxID=58114 RepID=A0A1G6ZCZ7_9ACTN|nr:SseB family protein [Glycomyces harbinensis]SDE00183.1 SseB protein N-terminal domain-containing protein [Glycomyces harbinensis]
MWEPSNEIERHLREALRAEDQDGYFRILAQIELVLPLSYEDNNGGGSDTWATWTTDDRTHILAFTSETALQVCLRDNAGASRRVSFTALAESWPDEDWWLAVNPGLPIEGYLPAWFVSQVAQGMTTVPVDPAAADQAYDAPPARSEPQRRPERNDPFAAGQSDPFANPMAPAPASREGSFMPPAPPVPDVPPAPRRSSDLSGSPGQKSNASTVAGTTPAGLPLRQPPQESGEHEAFNGHAFASQPPPPPEQHYAPPAPQGYTSQPQGYQTSQPQGYQPPPQGYTSQPQGFGSQPQGYGSQPQGFGSQQQNPGSQPQEQSYPADPHWPSEQDQWPDAPDWLRDQEPDPLTLPTRAPAPPAAAPEPYAAGDSFGTNASFGNADAFGDEPRSAEAFASMSSAFGRRAPEPEPAPTPAAAANRPVELSGEDAEPLLAEAASSGDTASFLQTLLCASVILPVGDPAAAHIRVGDKSFRWSSDIVDGIIGITVYTTVERMTERVGEDTPHTTVPFGWLIQHWPGQEYALYVNPGTEVGANMSGSEVESLLKWAEAKDLLTFASEMERRQAAAARLSPAHRVQPILWQKTIPHHQVPFYLDRGYDRVGGFVHPADAVDHLRTPAQLYLALGLIRSSEDFSPTDDSVHVLRWTGYRTDLYPTALGGNDFSAAQARGGTVVEPGPFRGDGFAPSESPDDRIPEHKVDSVRLPHGAKILRIDSRGEVAEIALYDADTREWAPIDGAYGGPAAIEAPSVPALPPAPAPPAPAPSADSAPPPAGPMGEAYGYGNGSAGYDSALGEAWGDAGHYDLVRPAPEDRAASVLDHRDWKDA